MVIAGPQPHPIMHPFALVPLPYGAFAAPTGLPVPYGYPMHPVLPCCALAPFWMTPVLQAEKRFPASRAKAMWGAKSVRKTKKVVPAASAQEAMQAMQTRRHGDVDEDESMCQRLLAELADHNTRPLALVEISNRALPLSLSSHGCRVVQKAFDEAQGHEREQLTSSLSTNVKILSESMHGNFVLAKLVEILNPSDLDFVPEQLRGHELAMAKHRFGCRVLQRLIEHCTDQQMHDVFVTIVNKAANLCRHSYGNFVIQHLIEHVPQWRLPVLRQLLEHVPSLAVHRTASHVVQKCLEFCEPRDQQCIVDKLLEGRPHHMLKDVACSRHGSYILAHICEPAVPPRISVCAREAVRASLAPLLSQLESSQFGVRVAAEMRRADDAERTAAAAVGGA